MIAYKSLLLSLFVTQGRKMFNLIICATIFANNSMNVIIKVNCVKNTIIMLFVIRA